MLQCSFEIILLLSNTFKKVIAAAKKLKNMQIFENVIVNTMNFDKTVTEVLFFVMHAEFFSYFSKTIYRFALTIVFNEVVIHQWQQTIFQFLSLILILIYDKKLTIQILFRTKYLQQQCIKRLQI